LDLRKEKTVGFFKDENEGIPNGSIGGSSRKRTKRRNTTFI